MISNQFVQNILNETTAITGADAAVCSGKGRIIAVRGQMDALDERLVEAFIRKDEAESQSDGFSFQKAMDGTDVAYVAVARTASANGAMTAKLLKAELENAVYGNKERIDRDDFIKNLLMDNLLQIDIFNRARKIDIDFKAPRAVYVIESNGEEAVYEAVSRIVSAYENDFVTGIDEGNQIVIHELKDAANAADELAALGERMLAALKDEGIEAKIAYGSVVDELKDVSNSYKEARLAHNVRRIFYEDAEVISYSQLGIGRLIYQLPINLCRMFINEIFGGRTLDEFDDETLMTINKFFENNLNVSETSRQLFIHRNTLVYRLDKLQKTAGLDLRVFDDAITFKIALMVVKYIDYMDRLDY